NRYQQNNDENLSVTVESRPQVTDTNLFNYNENGIGAKTRQKRNNQAIDLAKKMINGEMSIDDITAEQKILLSQYSGSGGGLTSADGIKGSAYEYYTPKAIAQGMWDLLREQGFDGGEVLDPCAGTGIFSATAPDGVLIQSVELDQISGTINKAIFNDDNHQVTISPFEIVAASTNDESVDAVIANVPFGDERGSYRLLDNRYQDEGLDGYFILRSLDKLRPGKLAVFMSSTSVISNRGKERLRQRIALKADFLGAYRMPNKLFDTAGADVVTDIMVLRKHSRENKVIIDDFAKSNADILVAANVLREDFISGKYFETEGRKYILGETTQVKSRWGDQVLKVVNDDSIQNIAKLLRRFGGSQIDWDLLDTSEPLDIKYQNGDIIFFGGVQKVYQDGKFINLVNEKGEFTYQDSIKQRAEKYTGEAWEWVEQRLDLSEILPIYQEVMRQRYIPHEIFPKWVVSLYNMSQRNAAVNEFSLGIYATDSLRRTALLD
ncbi:N-6 DNA methylase, partial [Chelonobacter oris]|uniref:N-6 DNA methylase n=1 Tax=Chelonobacter oris TaxID=505317 RepID=UPI00244B2FA0